MHNNHRLIVISSLACIVGFSISTGISAASPIPRTENLNSLGSAEGNSDSSINLSAEVHEAKMDQTRTFLSITWSIENSGNQQEGLAWLKDGSYIYSGQNFAGVTTTDPSKGVRYHPIMDGEGSCLCSGERSNEFVGTLNPGEKIAYWSLFSVPEDVETVTVEIPNFDPIEDIPIS